VNWEDEPYIKEYLRDTVGYKLLPWQGKCIAGLIRRKLDRAGVMDLGKYSPAEAVSAMIDVPIDVVEIGLEKLISDGSFVVKGKSLICPNYIEAQEARQSDKVRQRVSRQRRRDQARAEQSQNVTNISNKESQNVTDNHTVSHGVTLRLEENRLKEKEIKKKKPEPMAPIHEIFEFWQTEFNHTKAKLDDKRKNAIKRALKTYTKEDLIDTIRGCKLSPYHMGDNKDGKVYDSLSTIFKSADTIEGHRDRYRGGNGAGTNDTYKRLEKAYKDAENQVSLEERFGNPRKLARAKADLQRAQDAFHAIKGVS
jgi:hypothetical protein